jgi:hypothetical protein
MWGTRIAYRQHFFERGTFGLSDIQTLTHAMDPYDSDSSLDEDFTETGVLLGYAAEEVIEDTISHLGGWPVCALPSHIREYNRTDNPTAEMAR